MTGGKRESISYIPCCYEQMPNKKQVKGVDVLVHGSRGYKLSWWGKAWLQKEGLDCIRGLTADA